MINTELQISAMTENDIAHLLDIQSEAYGQYFLETEDVIKARFEISPSTAWLAWHGVVPVGYLVGYLSQVGKITPLNEPFAPAIKPNCFYLHDLALNHSARGKGVSRRLIAKAIDFASIQKLEYLALISVQSSQDFWRHQGFYPYDALDMNEITHLNTYTDISQQAHYMIKKL